MTHTCLRFYFESTVTTLTLLKFAFHSPYKAGILIDFFIQKNLLRYFLYPARNYDSYQVFP